MPEPESNVATFWLSALTIDPSTGKTPEQVRVKLEEFDIEARPVWKPMHLQPVFSGAVMVGGGVSERIFATGLCLPSGSSLSDADRNRIADIVLSVLA